MKKVLLTVIASIALCGSIFAQYPYESYWPDFSDGPFEDQGALVAGFMINGHIIDLSDSNWNALEVAFFVGDECRGNQNYLFNSIEEYGDPYLTMDAMPVFFTDGGDVVSFKLYDHMNDVLYENCEVLYLGEPMTILTGEDHFEGWDDPENPIFLSFTSDTPTPVTFTKDIVGFNDLKDRYYLLSSPIGEVSPTEVDNMLANTYDFYGFDQTNFDAEANVYREWIDYDLHNFNLEVGKGYLYANSEDVTLTFTGQPFDEDELEIPLVYDANCYFPGWNLLGNPYDDDIIIWSDFYVMNEDGDEIIAGEEDGVGPMEGFFVIAEQEGESLTIENPTTSGGGDPMPGGKIVLNVGRNAGHVIDRASIRFGEGRGMRKVMLNENNTKVYIPQDNSRFAVARSAEVGEMPVNFEASENGNYTITVNPRNLEMNYMHLIDNMTGADIDLLANPSYSFDARTTDYASRFRLVFATGNSDDNFAFFNNGNLVVSNDGNATLQVVDVNGRILSSESINGSTSISMNVASGVYMIRLINGDNVKVQKVVVK